MVKMDIMYRGWASCTYKVQRLESSVRCKSFHVVLVESSEEVRSFPETQLREEIKFEN